MKPKFLAVCLFILLVPAGALAGHTQGGQRCDCETPACFCGLDDPFDGLSKVSKENHSNQAPVAGLETGAMAMVVAFLLWLRMR